MVSHGVVALLIAGLAQAAIASAHCSCACSAPAVFPAPCGAAVAPAPCGPSFEVGCCPGAVVEKKVVVPRTATEHYSYQVPTYSRQCYQQSAGVDRKVQTGAFETAPVCETQETIVKVPTTDVVVNEQPLCRKTCTTSEYVIQIPIVETTCTSAPLCKKTIQQQDNTLTTVSRKTNCAKQVCTQNKVTETPLSQTVCQNYQGCETKVGTKTVVKPEIIKECVQLPPYKCLKPVSSGYGDATYAPGYAYGSYPVDSVYSGYSAAAAYPATYAAGPATYAVGPATYAAGPAAYVAGPATYSTAVPAYGSYSDAVYPGSYYGPASYSTYPAKTCTCV